MLLHVLEKEKLINVPKWLADNTAYLTIMGSEAYGVSSGDSDRDIYGFVMPPKTHIFPHLDGYIYGFHNKPDVFSVWTQHHIKHNQYEYDFSVYSIVKYFDLMLECNPSMINSLFVPRRCIIHSTTVSEHLREKRKMFLHKGCKAKFSGFAYSQMHKMDLKKSHDNPKRAASIAEYGYDVKYGYHLVRLMLECEQILSEGDLDIERNREVLKSIRRGEWSLEKLKSWFADKEKFIDELYNKSTIPYGPDVKAVKSLLLECIEMHYGSIDNAVKLDVDVEQILDGMQALIDGYRK